MRYQNKNLNKNNLHRKKGKKTSTLAVKIVYNHTLKIITFQITNTA